ncbi:hypothetical protein VOLCADRAFT_96157 [Volvox carteri f. nagariensis]|uniref:Uncharacterized protein n=1 Tax=Volvox carteri f. nagariensis TaxID=3068 RepID=D8U9C9_VOLCA|nr:uncharacterized protein VOLCADRAFT_96157 [Volvox carteri f. nagariensis]EFJ43617.1 hypothetical protein VOLCADRAFT_96157 [Volvox carteri f. nagariensis]|eukprot:XP_002955317.1 hypothetical protein VOLCADRAFT_96157 [Volvox carteri f. nagariensis]
MCRTTKVGLPNPSSGKKSGIPSGGTRSRQANLGSTSSGRAKASGSSGGQPRSPPPQPVPGPLFNLEDWFVHCHATEPDWKLPNDLLSPKKAEKLVKRSIMVLQTMGSTAGSSSPGGGGGQGNQVLLGDWIAAFAMRYRGSARSSLVNQSVQVLWWNDPCDPRQDSNHPFLYGTWYAGKTLSVNYKTGHLKVRYTDGEEHEVAMGVNFVHFGEKHPTGNEPARLPPLPPAVQPSQQAVEAGLKAGLAASGADGSSGRRRGRSTGSSGGARQAGGPGSVCSIDPGGRQGSAVASLFIEATETGAHGKVPKPGAVKAEAVAETGGGSGGDGGVGGSNALQAPPPSGPSARPSLGGAWPQKRPKLATVETVNGSNASADGSGRDSRCPAALFTPQGRTALGPEDQNVGSGRWWRTHRKPREQAQPPLPPHAASIAAKGENGGVQSSSGRDAKRRRIGSLTWNPRASSKGFSGPAQSTASRSGLAPNDGTGLFLRTTPEQKVSALSGAADTAVPLAMVTVDETSSRTTVAAAATEVVVVVRVAPSQSGQPSHQEQHTSDGKVDTSMAESPGAEMQPAEGVPPGSGPAGRLRLGGHVELDCGAHEGSTEAERPTDGGVEPSGQAEAAGDGQATEAVMGIGGGASSARYAASGSAAGDEPGAGGADSDAGAAHNGGIHLGMVTELDEPGKQGPFGGPAEGQEEGGAAGAADAGHPTSGCDVVAGGVQDGCVAGAPGGGSCSADGTVVARCNSARRGGNPTVDIESRGRRPERLAAGGSSAVAVTEAAPATATGITVQALTVTMAMAEAAVAGIMETAQAPGGPAASRGKEHVYAAASEATSAISTGEGACATAAAAGGPALEAKAVTANPAIDVTTAPGDMDIAKDDGHGLEHTAWQPDLAPCSAAPVSSSEAALVAGSDGTIPVLVSGSHPLQVDPSLGHEGAVLCSALVVGPGDDATQNQSQKVATKGDVGDGKGGAGAGAAGPECDTGRDASAAGGAVTNANLRGVEAQALALAPPASTASAADAANGAMAVAGVEAATAPGNEAEAMASGVACGAGRGSGDAVAAVIPLDTSDTAVTLSLALGAAADTSGGGGDDVGGHGSGADSSNKNAAAGIGAGGAGVGAGSSHDRDTGITAEEGVTGYGIGPGSSGDGMAARVPPPSSVEEHEAGAASGMDGHAAVAHRGDRRTGEHLDLTSEAALPVGPMGRIPDGATIDTGSANAVDRIPCALPPELAPPPELPDAVVQEWLAWWFVASSVGYARQAAQVLSLARQAAAGLRVNFTAIIEDSCRRLGCYPLHLRVLQVHFIQHAYVSFHRVAPELGAKLANQLLMLMKLFINEATLEQQERDMAGAAAPSATATLPPAQPPVLLPSGSNTGGGCGIGGRRATGSVGGASTGGSAAGPGIAQPGMPPAATSPHQQQERGLTVEEFWQVVAMCGSHCVQLVIIAMQCERAGKPIPKEVHDRLPDFAELLRWAAAAAPIRPAPASSPTGQRQFDILRRFNVTVIRIVRRLHASAEGNQQRASSADGAVAAPAGASPWRKCTALRIDAAAAAVGAADAEVAGAGAGVEDVADATVLPDPAAVPCMGAGWLDTSVRALITRHVRAHRPSPGSGQEEGTRQPASAAADTAAGGCITPCPDTGIASATAPSTSVARTAEEGEKEDRATGCAKRLGRVMAAWGALPPAQQRALYLVSCRMARDLNGVGNWWAVEMAVETLETLAEAAEKRRVIPDVESAGCADGAGGVEPTH